MKIPLPHVHLQPTTKSLIVAHSDANKACWLFKKKPIGYLFKLPVLKGNTLARERKANFMASSNLAECFSP